MCLVGVFESGVVLDESLDLVVLGEEELGESLVFGVEGVCFKGELVDGGL